MLLSGAEVSGVELVGGTDFGRATTGGWSVVATGGASPSRDARREPGQRERGRGRGPSLEQHYR
jgi:hypothetical protein